MDQKYGYQEYDDLPKKPHFNTASTLRRIGAYIIDMILLLILMTLLFFPLILFGIVSQERLIGNDPATLLSAFYRASYFLMFIISAVIDLAYFTFLESEKGGGATIGKRALDIKVIDEYKNEVGLGTSFIRNIARLLWQIPCIGFIILIIDVVLIVDSDQRIGDRLAHTYVIEERDRTRGYSDYTRSEVPPLQR